MTKKILLALISLCLVVGLLLVQPAKKKIIGYTTFKTQSGWGYDILVKNKIIIHQENIPALAEDRGFTTQQQAYRAAGIVSEKLSSGKMPSLSVTEVQSILEEK